MPPAHLETLVGSLRLDPVLFTLYIVAFVQMFGAGLLVPIAAIYAKRVVGLSEHAIGVIFLTVVIAVGLGSLPAGRLADRIGKRSLIAVGLVLGTVGMWMLAVSRQFIEMAGAAVLLGMSYAVTTPAWLALVSELAPYGRLGLTLGAAETVQGLGLVLGPLLGGVLWDAFGPQAPFVGSAIALTTGTVIAIATLRRRAT